ncbi:hypothetical protein EJB05_02772, partial [Eragrostis curvula]
MAPVGPLVFAGKSVLAPVVKEIITKAFKYLNGYFSPETMEEMKTKLEDGMLQIQAMLDIVSPDHIEGEIESLDQWFWKFRDAVEEAEDDVDEIEYYELEEKAKDHQVSDWGSPFAKAKHKVITSVKHVSVLDKTVKQFTHRGTLKRLKKAVDGLDKAVAGATNFFEVVNYLKGATSNRSGLEEFMSKDRQTGSTSTVTKFVGREKEKKQILEWLTKRTTVEEEAEVFFDATEEAEVLSSIVPIPIFSLVGHGGMGKTTLAQTICEQGEVVKHFKIIWVTVSTSFNATVVTRKILESIDKKIPKADSLEPMQQILKDNLKSFDKFLLIFDDVWEENKRDEWEKLFAPLRMGSIGSKILLTTRNASVAAMAANMMKVARAGLTLKELHEDDSLELFSHHVFSGMNSQDYSDLKVIGEQIARKLGGCPLVTKVVGGHLQGNMTREFWDKFLHEELEEFKGNSDDIMKVLRLSYYHLPTELQICFRYCSIFPQDYEFEKKGLVLNWIGSGLISTRENEEKRLEEIGETYLFQLATKSFFDKEIRRTLNSDGEEIYVMHDLMHELAEYVSFGECKRITSPGGFTNVKDTIRHLHIEDLHGPNVDNFKKLAHFKNLRSLIISARIRKHMEGTVGNIIENSRSLRLLWIDYDNPFNFPKKTGSLKHLRSLWVTDLEPENIHVIHKLYHLMVLGVKNNLQIDTEKLRNMGSLDRLQYLTFDRFGQFPVSGLTSLQVLNDYKVQGSKGNKINDIGNLKYLRKLEVLDLQNVDNSDEARNAKLKEKKYLKSLSLRWSASSPPTQNRIDDLVLDQLEPHVNIRKLSIHDYKGLRLPFWMDNDNLTIKQLVTLELLGCINWEQLPFLGELVLLRHLTLDRLPKLQQIGRSSLVSSSSSMESYLPPSLHSLRVMECLKLKEIPLLPTSLVYLELKDVGLTKLPRIGKLHSEDVDGQQSCLTTIQVTLCTDLVSLDGSFLDQKQCLGGVRDLSITWNLNLEMRMLGGGGEVILTSVTKLSLGLCGDLKLPLLVSLQYATNLSFLELYGPDLVSLPSADVWSNLNSLRRLEIDGWGRPVSLGWLGSLPSLSYLSIARCCKLVEAARSSLTSDASGGEEEHLVVLTQLDDLRIDFPSLLLVQPLKSLRHTRELRIEDASGTEGLPERWLLQNCASLQSLYISKAELLPLSIRDLSSLQKLFLSELEKKIRGYGSPEQDKISHVPRAYIGEWRFIFGKECSMETYDELGYADDNTLACWANQQDNGKGVESALMRWRNLRRLGGAS